MVPLLNGETMNASRICLNHCIDYCEKLESENKALQEALYNSQSHNEELQRQMNMIQSCLRPQPDNCCSQPKREL